MPILANISDEIMKAHYIKKLARTLEVEEEDVRAQLAKISNPPAERDPALQGQTSSSPQGNSGGICD